MIYLIVRQWSAFNLIVGLLVKYPYFHDFCFESLFSKLWFASLSDGFVHSFNYRYIFFPSKQFFFLISKLKADSLYTNIVQHYERTSFYFAVKLSLREIS